VRAHTGEGTGDSAATLGRHGRPSLHRLDVASGIEQEKGKAGEEPTGCNSGDPASGDRRGHGPYSLCGCAREKGGGEGDRMVVRVSKGTRRRQLCSAENEGLPHDQIGRLLVKGPDSAQAGR
jgi:hypothetical protein